jgi:transcriptional regulator with XRE-family HTH domain
MKQLFSSMGERIRAARQNNKWTLDDLANHSRLSKGFLSDIENDKRNCSSSNVIGLSDTLGVSVEWLLRGARSKPMKCPTCNGEGKIQF